MKALNDAMIEVIDRRRTKRARSRGNHSAVQVILAGPQMIQGELANEWLDARQGFGRADEPSGGKEVHPVS